MFYDFTMLNNDFFKSDLYDNQNARNLYLHFLKNINREEKKWNGFLIKVGEFISSLRKISVELSIPKQQLETLIKKFEEIGLIKKESTKTYTKFKIKIKEKEQDNINALNNTEVRQYQDTIKTVTNTEPRQHQDKESKEITVLDGINQDTYQDTIKTAIKTEVSTTIYKDIKDKDIKDTKYKEKEKNIIIYNNIKKEKENLSDNLNLINDLKDTWNEKVEGNLNKIKEINTKSEKRLNNLINKYNLNLEMFKVLIDKILKSEFHIGQNEYNWKASFDWLIEEKNFLKIKNENFLKNKDKKQKNKFVNFKQRTNNWSDIRTLEDNYLKKEAEDCDDECSFEYDFPEKIEDTKKVACANNTQTTKENNIIINNNIKKE